MTNGEILKIAAQQSAIDMNCRAEDFFADENIIVRSAMNIGARKYLDLPFVCNLVTYGYNIVASLDCRWEKFIAEYIKKRDFWRCFETPDINALNKAFSAYSVEVCHMAEYFLPDIESLRNFDCGYDIKIIEPDGFKNLYKPEWSNALCEKRKNLDVLAVGAFDGLKLVGLAGCSADCDSMYQIGIDVLPEYRRRGIACSLTSRIASEILKMGKVPFYCASWANIKSVRNALKCGFKPAWSELTLKKI